jgi:hypothetical protein
MAVGARYGKLTNGFRIRSNSVAELSNGQIRISALDEWSKSSGLEASLELGGRHRQKYDRGKQLRDSHGGYDPIMKEGGTLNNAI